LNANSKQNSREKLQAASTSIPVASREHSRSSPYVLYTYDLQTSTETKLGTFSDDTAILANQEEPTIASLNLQGHLQHIQHLHLHIIEKWLKKWKIKFNESKSSHIKFTLSKCHCPAVNSNQTVISETEVVKCLGLGLICRLNWKENTEKKKKKTQKPRDQLLDRNKIPFIYRKKITHLQSENQTDIELWNGNVGLR
jgi:hypothetical protein